MSGTKPTLKELMVLSYELLSGVLRQSSYNNRQKTVPYTRFETRIVIVGKSGDAS